MLFFRCPFTLDWNWPSFLKLCDQYLFSPTQLGTWDCFLLAVLFLQNLVHSRASRNLLGGTNPTKPQQLSCNRKRTSAKL